MAFAGLAVAVLVFAWARGRRLGPPDQPNRTLPPPRAAYIDALAGSLARTNDPAAALDGLTTWTRERVAQRGGLGATVETDELERAARDLGFDEAEVAALRQPPRTDTEVLALGRVGRACNRRDTWVNELRDRILREIRKVVVGQDHIVDVMVAAASVRGHLLLEGVPGVAKTLLANAFGRAVGLEFRRVQFTPDMLPSDLTGTMTLRGNELAFRPGPVFTSLLLADEINRTPPKTQAALLEAMQENQVSVDGVPHPLPDPFLVVATQNPIEYEGTYPLPEAQLDRFLAKLDVGYPSPENEAAMLRLTAPRRCARHARPTCNRSRVPPI